MVTTRTASEETISLIPRLFLRKSDLDILQTPCRRYKHFVWASVHREEELEREAREPS